MWCQSGWIFLLGLVLSGCASLEVAREIQRGRANLRFDNPQAALFHFEAAARVHPSYVTNFTPLDIGIWTYIGRSHDELGNREKAREAFERAVTAHDSDYLAKMYLGLVRVEDGNRSRGLAQAEAGLTGLRDWLDSLPGRTSDGKYWDPDGRLARVISETLTILADERTDWSRVGQNVRWLGREFDEEIDRVRRDIELEMRHDAEEDGVNN